MRGSADRFSAPTEAWLRDVEGQTVTRDGFWTERDVEREKQTTNQRTCPYVGFIYIYIYILNHKSTLPYTARADKTKVSDNQAKWVTAYLDESKSRPVPSLGDQS